jgi:hypothetical protein
MLTHRVYPLFVAVCSCLIAGSVKIPVAQFQAALTFLGVDMDMDEIECVFANLIHRGLVKGYISHAHRTVVFAKANAFPKQS